MIQFSSLRFFMNTEHQNLKWMHATILVLNLFKHLAEQRWGSRYEWRYEGRRATQQDFICLSLSLGLELLCADGQMEALVFNLWLISTHVFVKPAKERCKLWMLRLSHDQNNMFSPGSSAGFMQRDSFYAFSVIYTSLKVSSGTETACVNYYKEQKAGTSHVSLLKKC